MNYTREQIKTAVEAKGYKWFNDDANKTYDVNIVGIRNESTGKKDVIEFDHVNFNYFKIGEDIMNNYNDKEKNFFINGYKYSIPTIGVENSLTNFLISKSKSPDAEVYNDYFYGFTYFIGDKSSLSFDEIENLIQIFNFDIDESELSKIKDILKIFAPMQHYSLISDGKVIEISSKINLEKIWK